MSDNRSQLSTEQPKRKRTTLIDFVKAWQSSNTVDEVAEKLGISKTSVQARASKYRSGVLAKDSETFIVEPIALKTMRRGGGGPRLDAQAANRLIEELGNGNVDQDVEALKRAKIARASK